MHEGRKKNAFICESVGAKSSWLLADSRTELVSAVNKLTGKYKERGSFVSCNYPDGPRVSVHVCVCVRARARSEKQLVKTRDCHFQKTDIFLSENGQELLSLALLPKKKKARGGRDMWEAASLPVKWIFDCACSFCDITGAEAPGFPTRASLPTIPEVSRLCCHHLSRYHLSLSPSVSLSIFLLLHPACLSASMIRLSLGTITQMLVQKKKLN